MYCYLCKSNRNINTLITPVPRPIINCLCQVARFKRKEENRGMYESRAATIQMSNIPHLNNYISYMCYSPQFNVKFQIAFTSCVQSNGLVFKDCKIFPPATKFAHFHGRIKCINASKIPNIIAFIVKVVLIFIETINYSNEWQKSSRLLQTVPFIHVNPF